MSKKVANKKLQTEIRGIIVESIHDALNDPEYGRELQEWIKERLKKYRGAKDFTEFVSEEEVSAK